MAVWSPEAVKEFINLYKSQPCLWKVKSSDYSNRRARIVAYEELIKYCKDIGFKSATQDFVRKKIMHLRGAFAKELRKVIQSMQHHSKPEDVYKPSLWYFDLLLFTKDQQMDKDDDKQANSEKRDSDEDNDGGGKKEMSLLHAVNLPSYSAPVQNSTSIKKDQTSERSFASEDSDEGSFNGAATSWSQPPKKRKMASAAKQTDFSEYDAVGVAIARKLQRMDPTQCLYAETIIHAVLRKGLMNQLSDITDLCENHCNRSYNIDEFR